jgi:hypothetical protein
MLRFLSRIAILSSIFIASPLLAQTASITGSIQDPQGAAIRDAEVRIAEQAQGTERTLHTNDAGAFFAPFLNPGPYRIYVQAPGFSTAASDLLTLTVGQTLVFNVHLTVGSAQQQVVVDAQSELLNTTDATVGTVVDRQFVENLPLNGRSFHSLLELTPGVVLTATQEQGEQGQFAINGSRADANNFQIDGVSANFAISPSSEIAQDGGGALPALSALGGTSNLVSVDALQEFRVETSNASSEYGRGGAQIVLVTRSGSNRFHGSLFDYLRNDIFDANDWFADNNDLPKPPIRQNDFGGVFGGRIRKDSTFFFFSYEGLRLREPKVAITDVPSLFARQNAPAASLPYLNAYSIPNGPATYIDANGNVLANQYSATFSDPATLDAYSLRVDQAVGAKLSLFARFNDSPSWIDTRNTGSYAPIADHTITSNATRLLTAGATLLLSNHLTDDVRFNWSTDHGSVHFRGDNFGGAVPLPDSVGFPSGFGSSANSNAGMWIENLRGTLYQTGVNARNNGQHQIQITDSVSLLRGRHQWKAGFDFRRLEPTISTRLYDLFPFFDSSESLQSGVADSVNTQDNSIQPRLRFFNIAAYLQDSWKTSDRLTLSYGIRWERNPAPSELTGHPPIAVDQVTDLSTTVLAPLGTPPWKASYLNFSPRFGVNYVARQTADWPTVVRAGFGVYYALGTETAGNIDTANPYATTTYFSSVPLPLQLPSPQPASLTPPYNPAQIFDPHLKTPYNLQYSGSIEQGLGAAQRFTITYTGSVGRRLLRQNTLSSQYLPVNPIFTSLLLTDNSDYSNYNSLQVEYQHRLQKRLQVLASYTWAHSLDNGSSDTVYSSGYDDSNQLPSNFYNVHQDYGNAVADIRNTFSAAATYDLPGSGLQSRIPRALLQGWSIDGVTRARSAPPYDVIYSPSVSKFFDLFTPGFNYLRPDSVPRQPLYLSNSAAPGGRVLNANAFAMPEFDTPDQSRQGTEGRNQLRAFDAVQTDLSVRRNFILYEELHLSIRLDAFNVLNHPSFGYPQNVLNYSGFGSPTQTLAQTLGSGNGFGGGFNPLYAVGGPRSMQASMKIQF